METILIIEDDAALALGLCRALKSEDRTLQSCGKIREARRILREAQPDLVILDNAVKYTSRGGIEVRTRRYELFTAIEVEDTGPGIAEEDIPELFGRFRRGEETAEQEGVGIGLYLAREILAGEGGYIKVSSRKGKGSVFSIFLPNQGKGNLSELS